MRARIWGLVMVVTGLLACGGGTEPVSLHVLSLDFTDAAELDNRHDYEISGDDFDTPHLLVQDRVFEMRGAPAQVDLRANRRLLAGFDEPAPYTRSTPMRLVARFTSAAAVPPEGISVRVQGMLHSETDPSRPAVPLLEAELQTGLEDEVVLTTAALPDRVDLYALHLSWVLAPLGCNADCEGEERFETVHLIPTTWRTPRPEAPRYKRTFLWSSKFGAGTWPDEGPLHPTTRASEDAIAKAMLDGFAQLHTLVGKSYGAFHRPEYDGEVDGVDVFLDYPRSACGELKHGLMAMIEYQGVDAQWGVFEFLKTGPDRYSQYVTREATALGREPMVWYQTNHAFVVVNGKVYDPTYNGHAASVTEYEDQLFEKFCFGQEEPCRTASDWCNDPPRPGVHCVDNAPGRDPEIGFVFYAGDSYR